MSGIGGAATLAIAAASATLTGVVYCTVYCIIQRRRASAVGSRARTGPRRGMTELHRIASLSSASDQRPMRAGPLNSEAVLEAVRTVIDPELGHNIVDLGLIYGLEVQNGLITVTMTMTTRGCPAQDYIVSGVQERCRRLPGAEAVRVDLVWDPPWSPQKMSPAARAQSGIAS